MLPYPVGLPRACQAQDTQVPSSTAAFPAPVPTSLLLHHTGVAELPSPTKLICSEPRQTALAAPSTKAVAALMPPHTLALGSPGTHRVALVQFSAFCAPVAGKGRAEQLAVPTWSPVPHEQAAAAAGVALPLEVIRFSA